MFGTSDPDLRALSGGGKIGYDELSRMMGSDKKGNAEAFAKKGGKPDLRDFGLMTPSGGNPAQEPSSTRPAGHGEGERRPGKDKAKGTSKARRAGHAPKAAAWDEDPSRSPPASSPTSIWWVWEQDSWWPPEQWGQQW